MPLIPNTVSLRVAKQAKLRNRSGDAKMIRRFGYGGWSNANRRDIRPGLIFKARAH